jgi:hypothetical protein
LIKWLLTVVFFSRSFLRYSKYVTRNWISWVSFSNKKLMILVNRIPSMHTLPPDRCWKIQPRHSSGLELILKYYRKVEKRDIYCIREDPNWTIYIFQLSVKRDRLTKMINFVFLWHHVLFIVLFVLYNNISRKIIYYVL